MYEEAVMAYCKICQVTYPKADENHEQGRLDLDRVPSEFVTGVEICFFNLL
jgi:hypothetical protein